MINTMVEYIAENSGEIYEFNSNYRCFHKEYIWKDGDDLADGWKFEYEIYDLAKYNKYAIVVTYWNQKGQVWGCSDCATTELHNVFVLSGNVADANKKEKNIMGFYAPGAIQDTEYEFPSHNMANNNFYNAILATPLPIQVHNYFLKELREAGYIEFQKQIYA